MHGREMQQKFKDFGIRQHQVADCVGLNPAVLSNILTEKVRPQEGTEKRLIRLLDLCDEVETVINRRLQIRKRLLVGDEK